MSPGLHSAPASVAPAAAAPAASFADQVQTLNMKIGCCYIRTNGTLYTYEPNADLRIDLTKGATTLRTLTRAADICRSY